MSAETSPAPQIGIASPASERRLLAYINADGAPAMTICGEAGLTPESFSMPSAARLFAIAAELHGIQLLSDKKLAEEAVSRQQAMDWPEYVQLTSDRNLAIASLEVPTLCREIRRHERARALQRSALRMTEALKQGDAETVGRAIVELQSADLSSKPRATWRQTGGVQIEMAEALMSGKVAPDERSIGWPFRSLDVDLKPFRRGEMVVVGGRPSDGKSSLLRQICLAAAGAGNQVAFVSLEVPAPDVFNLMAGTTASQPWSRLKDLHPKDQAAFVDGLRKVREMPIEVLDDAQGLAEIIGWLRNRHSQRFLDVIAVDYLGLVSDCSPQKNQTKAQAVGDVASAFKRLAAELGCVVFVAAQINRGPANDGNRPPRLSDLRDSGDIEAHADRVLLLYRPDTDRTTNTPQAVHDPVSVRPRFYVELFQEKGRNAGTGQAALWLRRELARFELIANA